MMANSCMEKLRGRKFKFPSMERQKGMISQQRSPRPYTKISKTAMTPIMVRGIALPLRVSLVNQGAATKKARVIRKRQTFWTVKFCTEANYPIRLSLPTGTEPPKENGGQICLNLLPASSLKK